MRSLRSYSLVSRMITAILLTELLAAVCLTGVALVYERHQQFRAFDVMLRGRADSLLGAVQDSEDAHDSVMLDGTEASLPRQDLYLVEDNTGRIVGRSANWTLEQERYAWQHSVPLRRGAVQRLFLGNAQYRALRLEGLRIIDPADKPGGTPRRFSIVYAAPTAPVEQGIRETVEFYAVSSLLLLVVTGLLLGWLLNRALLPLHALTADAARVSVDTWEFAPSDRVRSVRELAPLASAIALSLERLRASFQQQERFVSDAAHELKTSTAVVKSSLQVLTLRPRTVADYDAGLRRALTDCSRMEEIVHRMLTLARVEGYKLALPENILTRLDEALHQVATQLQPLAETRGIRLVLEPGKAIWVHADASQLRVLCSNLLMNAIQHSHPGGEVRLTAVQTGPDADLRVADQGEGIPPEALPHVFERFFRGDGSRSRETGGAGLGLAISKAIVRAADGDISIASDPGHGTTVHVRLPSAPAPQVSLQPETAAPELHTVQTP